MWRLIALDPELPLPQFEKLSFGITCLTEVFHLIKAGLESETCSVLNSTNTGYKKL